MLMLTVMYQASEFRCFRRWWERKLQHLVSFNGNSPTVDLLFLFKMCPELFAPVLYE